LIAVVQRVLSADVKVDDKTVSKIKEGFLVLLGCEKGDGLGDAQYIAKKLVNLRIFSDEDDKMNLSIKDMNGEMIIVSQFTLLAKTRKGNRPSFTDAELPEAADKLYMKVVELVEDAGVKAGTGIFGADMKVSLVNDGPVTIILNSKDTRK
jgi:D-tyrosyl-tRNA(Tyr) deacylase